MGQNWCLVKESTPASQNDTSEKFTQEKNIGQKRLMFLTKLEKFSQMASYFENIFRKEFSHRLETPASAFPHSLHFFLSHPEASQKFMTRQTTKKMKFLCLISLLHEAELCLIRKVLSRIFI